MGPIEGKDLERVRDVLAKHDVEYLFVGKMAAILQGYPDTTQDADLFVDKTAGNGERLTAALKELGFNVTDELAEHIRQQKDFIQLTDGPFDLDLVYAPDGIEKYEDARRRAVEHDGFPLACLEDVIESKRRSNRAKDRESLPRLEDFARYVKREGAAHTRPLGPRRKPTRRGGHDDVPAAPARPTTAKASRPPEPARGRGR